MLLCIKLQLTACTHSCTTSNEGGDVAQHLSAWLKKTPNMAPHVYSCVSRQEAS
jgi:hypothetical protein